MRLRKHLENKMVILLILYGIALGVHWLVIYNLFSQNEQLESEVKKAYELNAGNIKKTEVFYQLMYGLFVQAKMDLDRVDKRGSYSSDDEVGFAFKTIQEAINQVKHQLEVLNPIDDAAAKGSDVAKK